MADEVWVLKRDVRELRRYLRSMVVSSKNAIAMLDAEMKKPSDMDRGKRIARITNGLELATDMALRFGLKETLNKAKKNAR